MFKKSNLRLLLRATEHVCCQRTPVRCFAVAYNNEGNAEETSNYKEHIRLSNFQRTFLAAGTGLASILNPARGDMIAIFGETTGTKALSNMYSQMRRDGEGSAILESRPRINSSTVDLSYLSTLPDDSLGRSYVKFLEKNQVTPDSRLVVQFVDDAELAYVMQRYREAHDLVHTLLDMPTNMLGEVAVKWVEAIQTGLPMCITGAIFGAFRLRPKQRHKYVTHLLPWAVRVGRDAKPLLNIYYENRWEQSVKDIRREFNIEPPPKI